MSECKHENILRVDVSQLWCPDCDQSFALLQYRVTETPKESKLQTRLEILEEFYEACQAARNFGECMFVNTVSVLSRKCLLKLENATKFEENSSSTMEPSERYVFLSSLYKLVSGFISDPNGSFLNTAPRIRAALDRCARSLAKIEAEENKETGKCFTCRFWRQKTNPKWGKCSFYQCTTPYRFGCDEYKAGKRGGEVKASESSAIAGLLDSLRPFISYDMMRFDTGYDDSTPVRLSIDVKNGYGLTLDFGKLRKLWDAFEKCYTEHRGSNAK